MKFSRRRQFYFRDAFDLLKVFSKVASAISRERHDNSSTDDNSSNDVLKKWSKNLFPQMCSRQCDQMAILFFNVCPFVTMKMCPIALKNVPKGWIFCQILSKLANKCQRQFKCCHFGEISPNLFILAVDLNHWHSMHFGCFKLI